MRRPGSTRWGTNQPEAPLSQSAGKLLLEGLLVERVLLVISLHCTQHCAPCQQVGWQDAGLQLSRIQALQVPRI